MSRTRRTGAVLPEPASPSIQTAWALPLDAEATQFDICANSLRLLWPAASAIKADVIGQASVEDFATTAVRGCAARRSRPSPRVPVADRLPQGLDAAVISVRADDLRRRRATR